MSQARLAVESDVEAVVATVTAAFADDPAWEYMTGPGGGAAREAFARLLLLPRLSRGTAWVVDDGAAVAMWDRRGPGDPPPAPDADEALARFRAEVGEDVWARIDAYDTGIRAVAPPRPYWYLGVLATHPTAQGRGLATAVLEGGFAAAAADGWDCWLETSVPANKAFYAGRGFGDAVEADIPGGPPTWWLRRPHGDVSR